MDRFFAVLFVIIGALSFYVSYTDKDEGEKKHYLIVGFCYLGLSGICEIVDLCKQILAAVG